MVGEPARGDDDDTVLRAHAPQEGDDRAAAAVADTVLRPRRTDVEAGAVDEARAVDDDPLGDTVIRPAVGVRPPAVPSPDDTVVRPRRDGHASAPRSGDRVPGPEARLEPVHSPDADPSVGVPTRLPSGPVAPPRVPSIRVGGRVVRLDRPVVVGRRPAAPRVVHGAGPELVTVPSPTTQVSSSHLLVHAAGEAAVVDDLRSTNGTVVRPPGSAPFRMASGASIVVLTGTLVEIGDGNVIEVLSPHLRVGPDDGLPPFPSVP
ncbi:hypothetical protein [Curtobacterium sp. NPDC089185]|uniref:hypothetical protein n=1 Tax=Curtobacterium sp. NPDC089185 TaxID=3154968 RepID=UPI00342703EB